MRRITTLLLALSLALTACARQGYSGSSSSGSPSMSSSSRKAVAIPKWDGKLLKGKQIVILDTSMGNITLELDADVAPKTVTNFVTLAKAGYYDDITFHRVIPDFMIQGGDPDGTGAGGESIYGPEFADEINPNSSLYKTGYVEGVVAMANRGPDTNGSQFFIMDQDNPLPPSYTIFGRVVNGQDVVRKIATVKRNASDKPLEPVTFRVRFRN